MGHDDLDLIHLRSVVRPQRKHQHVISLAAAGAPADAVAFGRDSVAGGYARGWWLAVGLLLLAAPSTDVIVEFGPPNSLFTWCSHLWSPRRQRTFITGTTSYPSSSSAGNRRSTHGEVGRRSRVASSPAVAPYLDGAKPCLNSRSLVRAASCTSPHRSHRRSIQAPSSVSTNVVLDHRCGPMPMSQCDLAPITAHWGGGLRLGANRGSTATPPWQGRAAA